MVPREIRTNTDVPDSMRATAVAKAKHNLPIGGDFKDSCTMLYKILGFYVKHIQDRGNQIYADASKLGSVRFGAQGNGSLRESIRHALGGGHSNQASSGATSRKNEEAVPIIPVATQLEEHIWNMAHAVPKLGGASTLARTHACRSALAYAWHCASPLNKSSLLALEPRRCIAPLR